MKKRYVIIVLLSFGVAFVKGQSSAAGGAPFFGLNFSPYLESQSPDIGSRISKEQIDVRLQVVQPLASWIRTFSCGNGLESIGEAAHSLGLKTIVGAWISKDMAENERQLEALLQVVRRGGADLVAIGNEVLLRSDQSEAGLIAYISAFKKRLKDEGLDVKVTTVDSYYHICAHPKVIDACDFIAVNCYPFWEGASIDEATASLSRMYDTVVRAARGKHVIVSETGWPSDGNAVKKAVPSLENAQRYLYEVLKWSRERKVECFYFAAFDESWKSIKEGALGAHWGVMDTGGTLKYANDLLEASVVEEFRRGTVLPLDGVYIPSGYMGATAGISVKRQGFGSGAVYELDLSARSSPYWAGVYWQYPSNNWGQQQGLALRHPKRLSFMAKGARGGELVQITVGGISGAFADSIMPARSLDTTGTKLEREWKEYSIELAGLPIGSVIGGFCVTSSSNDNPQGCQVSISRLQFEW
jgi:glucan 1,3-beta-glucosidase